MLHTFGDRIYWLSLEYDGDLNPSQRLPLESALRRLSDWAYSVKSRLQQAACRFDFLEEFSQIGVSCIDLPIGISSRNSLLVTSLL